MYNSEPYIAKYTCSTSNISKLQVQYTGLAQWAKLV